MSNTPVSFDLPHKLGAQEARRRIAGGIGSLADHLPSGAKVGTTWNGDHLALAIEAIGQRVDAGVDVHDAFVRVQVVLPPALSFFTKPIEAALRRGGSALLEDKSGS
jgi:hypothetical protein